MMPYRVKFYGNDDCLLHYEDPHAAHAAPSIFDGQELKGSKLHVEMAEKKPTQGLPAGYYIPPEAKGQSYGSGGAGRGGGPPRGNYGPPGGNSGGGGGYGGPRRDDRRRARELEEARKAGQVPAVVVPVASRVMPHGRSTASRFIVSVSRI